MTPALLVSGGQTGVDRALLDVALERGIRCGGWCPAGRWAEDGPIPLRYPLRETPSPDPEQRTRWNVRDTDATVVLLGRSRSAGTELTLDVARRLGRPHAAFPLFCSPEPLERWLDAVRPRALNVAGPRESEAPGAYRSAYRLLHWVLAHRGGTGPCAY